MPRDSMALRGGGGAMPHRPASVGDELTHLELLDGHGLKAAWEARFTTAPPPLPARLLLLALAHEVQVRACRDLRPASARRLAKLAAREERSAVRTTAPVKLKPGTTLLRDWGGRMWRVEVNADGTFSFGGTTWRSLSAIAREITGTSRNGPAFFGLGGRPRA